MPISITVPERELYDEARGLIIEVPKTTLVLEHSLLSISKWEAKWHKAFLSNEKPTKEERTDYVRCMTVNQNVKPEVYYALTNKNWKDIESYMADPMTATVVNSPKPKKGRGVITNELIYYWMCELGIPFQPCEKWHINRLLMLIQVTSIKKQPPKKMSPSSIAKRNHSLNAARRAKHHTRG